MKRQLAALLAAGLGMAALPGCQKTEAPAVADAPDPVAQAPVAPAEPAPATTGFPEHVYFGDTHLHTSYSVDAGAFGPPLAPRDAYVFAKGTEETA